MRKCAKNGHRCIDIHLEVVYGARGGSETRTQHQILFHYPRPFDTYMCNEGISGWKLNIRIHRPKKHKVNLFSEPPSIFLIF